MGPDPSPVFIVPNAQKGLFNPIRIPQVRVIPEPTVKIQFLLISMVTRLEEETRIGKGGTLAAQLSRLDLIVLDELGYLPFARSGGQLLFHLRSEEHTSELQSLMRISYAVFCLKKKQIRRPTQNKKQSETCHTTAKNS